MMRPNEMCLMSSLALRRSKRSEFSSMILLFLSRRSYSWVNDLLINSRLLFRDHRQTRDLILPTREHHLQAALSASQAAAIGGKSATFYIPTPDAVQSQIEYEKLYPLKYSQPTSYLRFSSTVEDCVGCPYDMDEEDDAFLKSMNKKRNASTQCSEVEFEEVMHCFEETAQAKQPFAAVDSPPVLSYDEIESSIDDYLDDHAKHFAKDIYEHWKARRLEAGNKQIIASLKVSCVCPRDTVTC